jgi:hypothetical protein
LDSAIGECGLTTALAFSILAKSIILKPIENIQNVLHPAAGYIIDRLELP